MDIPQREQHVRFVAAGVADPRILPFPLQHGQPFFDPPLLRPQQGQLDDGRVASILVMKAVMQRHGLRKRLLGFRVMPEPGGLTVVEAAAMLRGIADRGTVAGAGVTGLAPASENAAPVARLASALGL